MGLDGVTLPPQILPKVLVLHVAQDLSLDFIFFPVECTLLTGFATMISVDLTTQSFRSYCGLKVVDAFIFTLFESSQVPSFYNGIDLGGAQTLDFLDNDLWLCLL